MAHQHTHQGQTTPVAQPSGGHKWLPRFLLSNALHIFTFRLVLALSVLAVMVTTWTGIRMAEFDRDLRPVWLALVLLGAIGIALHHTGTAFGSRIFRLKVWLDIGLLVAELAGCLACAVMVSRSSGDYISNTMTALVLVAAWSLTSAVAFLFFLRVVRFSKLSSPRDSHLLEIHGLYNKSDPWWAYPAQAIFGGMCRESLPGESTMLSLLRVVLAWSAIFALVGFGVHQAIILPLSEGGKIPIRTYRTEVTDLETSLFFKKYLSDLDFKVLLVWARHSGSTANLADAVTATAHWADASNPEQSVERSGCDVKTESLAEVPPSGFEAAVVTCQPKRATLPGDLHSNFPNFDVRVNYTGILGTSPPRVDRAGDSVHVYLGFTKDITQVFQNTEAVLLFPGTHILSVVNPVLRLRSTSANLATLGFEFQKGFIMATIPQTIPDPRSGPANNTQVSTLAFTLNNSLKAWTIIQDYQGRSVISGLSAFGGLGSFLSTLLGILLGTSLVQVFVRSKKNSPFGALHSVEVFQSSMIQKCEQKYPQLRSDVQSLEKEAGLLAYLLNTYIDMEPLRRKAKEQNAWTEVEVGNPPVTPTEGGEKGTGGGSDRTPEDAVQAAHARGPEGMA